MAKKFRQLYDKIPAGRRTRIERRVTARLEKLPLAAIRRARGLTQQQLAKELGVEQPTLSQLEHRTDLVISTLRRFIEATGGKLRIVAEYGDQTLEIDNLSGT